MRALLRDAFEAGLRLDETHLDLADTPIGRVLLLACAEDPFDGLVERGDAVGRLAAVVAGVVDFVGREDARRDVDGEGQAERFEVGVGARHERQARVQDHARRPGPGPGSKRASMASGSPNSAASVLLP